VFNKNLGNLGERKAFQYLSNLGYKFIDKNFHCPFGEIDLIFKDREEDCYVFVEVKSRINKTKGTPAEAITGKKIHSLMLTAEHFFIVKKIKQPKWRIDAVAILFNDVGDIEEFRHIENITG
jgi:putative endonuclease